MASGVAGINAFSFFWSLVLSLNSYDEETYGNTHKMRIERKTQSIEFMPKYSSKHVVLWRQEDPEPSEDSRRKMIGYYYLIYNVTQRDSGSYVLRDKNGMSLSTKTIEVIAKTQALELIPGEKLRFTSDLESNSCNIYFIPEGGRETELVHQGKLLQGSSYCPGFELLKPCGISNEAVQTSCKGLFEVKDHNGDTSLELSLKVESLWFTSSAFIPIGSAVVLSVLFWCMKSCCCGNSSTAKNPSEPEAAADDDDGGPAVYYQEYDHEPVGGRPTHPTKPTETAYPVQPNDAPTSLLIHNPPTMNLLPADSEVSAPAERLDPPAVPPGLDYEPRFEVKGMSTDSLLHSDSPHCDVYNSDKLNFL
ncbi:transcript variant X1 [Nothobranchius furzeri]|uniref:Transcript variant X1 n=1 Tax=Nothobranchius furzeri TaxID=105023 RepID=A0A1A8ANQ6_NOTFU|nr:transcript variant X1 [Nothobranchius furzeri]